MPSKIEYVDETWNPVTGCTKISPGCQNCYAERMARRLAGRLGYPQAPRHFDVTLHPDRLDEPLRRKKPTRYLVCSMGDLFHEDVPNEFIRRVVEIMAELAPDHTFLVLTKRPERVRDWFKWFVGPYMEPDGRLADNIWLGVTVESQEQMWRVEKLVLIPAARHWVSIEPTLGPVKLTEEHFILHGKDDAGRYAWYRPGVSWVVLGGETGPGARPMHPDWVRKVRDDCVAAGVDFWFKSWGAWRPAECWGEAAYSTARKHIWPRASANERTNLLGLHEGVVVRVGKKAAGRLLDGREWNEIPED